MKRTVITGGAGFIGISLVRKILRESLKNDEIIILDNLDRHGMDDEWEDLLKDSRIRWVNLDLTCPLSADAVPLPVDRLYHLAAIVGVGRVEADPLRVLKTNTLSTMHIADWFASHSTPDAHMVYASTSEVYAGAAMSGMPLPVPTPENVPLVISDIRHPRFSYAISKMWGEAYVLAQMAAIRKPIRSVRYHNVYGPRMGYDHVIPQVIQRIRAREEPFRIVGETQTRSFCFVDDAVEATYRVMEMDPSVSEGKLVHIGNSKQETPIRNLYEKLFALCGWSPKRMESCPAPPGSVDRRCPDTTLLGRLTGFQPSTSLDEGLRKTVDWYTRRQG